MDIAYALAYRFGFTPWERYGWVAAANIAALLDREEAELCGTLAARSISGADEAS